MAGVTGTNWKKRMTFASMMEAASEGRIRGSTGSMVSAEYSSATLCEDITPRTPAVPREMSASTGRARG